MDLILNKIQDLYSLGLVILILLSGLFIIFVDSKDLRKNGSKRASVNFKRLGTSYIVISIVLYIVVKLI